MTLEVHKVELHESVVASIKIHAKQQADRWSAEAVGFLARNGSSALGVATVPLHNHASNPSHAFFVEPWEQFKAEEHLAKNGYRVLGVYHSHVNSEALPSHADHKLARPGEVVVIYSVVFDELKAYKEVDGILEPAELEVMT